MRMVLTLALVLAAGPTLSAQVGSPAGAVPPARLAARRTALLQQVGSGVVLLQGAAERSNDPPDSDYPQDTDFRQDNDFFYLTGLEEPDAWLVLVAHPGQPGRVLLFLRPRNPAQERWLGARMGPAEAAPVAGLDVADVRSSEDLARVMDSLLAPASGGTGPVLYMKQTARTAASAAMQGFARKAAKVDNLLPQLAGLRAVKDEDEIARMRRAVAISAEGHLAAMRVARPGAWEYELEAAAEYEFRRRGAERLGYPSIVGTGFNATTLHYDENRAQLKDGELIVMDMGAEFGYMSADVTRTIPVSGKFTPRQRALYDLVLGSQQAAMDSVRPGITIGRLNQIARQYMQANSGTLCGQRTCDVYFIHGLSHHIGMDVHDVNRGGPLVPGMIFTIEPGIYIPEEALGVRIEDDVVVTATGYELLSGGAPRKAADIEAYMAQRR